MKMLRLLMAPFLAGCVAVEPGTLSARCDRAHGCAAGNVCVCGVCNPCSGAACEACALDVDVMWRWPLDDAPTGRATDCSGARSHGQAQAAKDVSLVSGRWSQAWALEPGDELTCPKAALSASSRTLSFFVSVREEGKPQTIYEERASGRSMRVVAARRSAQTVVSAEGGDLFGALSSDGVWVHVALVRAADDMVTLFVDGTAQPVGTMAWNSESASFHVASATAPATDALLDEIRAYPRALLTTEIVQLAAGVCNSR